MQTYDKHRIGKMLAWRGDHFVYEYGSDEVIKFSKLDYLLGFAKAQQVLPREYALFKEFFGEYLLTTHFASSPNGRYIASIQPRLYGKSLRLSDLKDESIAEQCREIIAAHHRLLENGHPEIDLMGHEGVFHLWNRCFGNIIITQDNQLRIFDATSLDLNHFAPFTHPVMAPLFRIFQGVQNSAIRAFKKELRMSV